MRTVVRSGRPLRRIAAVAGAAAVMVVGVAGPAHAADASSYGVDVNLAVIGGVTVDVGPLVPSSVGDSPNTAASVTAPPVFTAGAVRTTATADPATGGFASSATVADAALALGPAAIRLRLGADVIAATCTATQAGVTGDVTLTGLVVTVAGVAVTIPASPAPNTTIQLTRPNGTVLGSLILNEQITNGDGSLTVNAVHVQLASNLATGDVVISSATCGPAVLPVPLAQGPGLLAGLGVVAVAAAGWVAVRNRRRRQAPTAA